jgi:hypothetical protein
VVSRSVKAVSEGTLAEREKRLNEVYLAERMSKADYDREWQAIKDQRATLTVKPSPLFTQQQSILTTLVDAWEGANADEKKQAVARIFDSITGNGEGVDRLEPCEDWRPFMVAAIPKPVTILRAPTERKTGVKHAEVITARLVQEERGWLRLAS